MKEKDYPPGGKDDYYQKTKPPHKKQNFPSQRITLPA
jgi:hypothetical protein